MDRANIIPEANKRTPPPINGIFLFAPKNDVVFSGGVPMLDKSCELALELSEAVSSDKTLPDIEASIIGVVS